MVLFNPTGTRGGGIHHPLRFVLISSEQTNFMTPTFHMFAAIVCQRNLKGGTIFCIFWTGLKNLKLYFNFFHSSLPSFGSSVVYPDGYFEGSNIKIKWKPPWGSGDMFIKFQRLLLSTLIVLGYIV
jgi:hypothetical protein